MKASKLKQSISMTLSTININLRRKSHLPMKRPFMVSEKGRGFFDKAYLKADIANFAILVF